MSSPEENDGTPEKEKRGDSREDSRGPSIDLCNLPETNRSAINHRAMYRDMVLPQLVRFFNDQTDLMRAYFQAPNRLPAMGSGLDHGGPITVWPSLPNHGRPTGSAPGTNPTRAPRGSRVGRRKRQRITSAPRVPGPAAPTAEAQWPAGLSSLMPFNAYQFVGDPATLRAENAFIPPELLLQPQPQGPAPSTTQRQRQSTGDTTDDEQDASSTTTHGTQIPDAAEDQQRDGGWPHGSRAEYPAECVDAAPVPNARLRAQAVHVGRPAAPPGGGSSVWGVRQRQHSAAVEFRIAPDGAAPAAIRAGPRVPFARVRLNAYFRGMTEPQAELWIRQLLTTVPGKNDCVLKWDGDRWRG
ncbi:hypothetical protein GGR52DRAFT_575345 [Hypoxylon sp. FL1284]|nr:hypothetical protein GGR52DRAFT_575345 [Hypoxylon sp. FL1284]